MFFRINKLSFILNTFKIIGFLMILLLTGSLKFKTNYMNDIKQTRQF